MKVEEALQECQVLDDRENRVVLRLAVSSPGADPVIALSINGVVYFAKLAEAKAHEQGVISKPSTGSWVTSPEGRITMVLYSYRPGVLGAQRRLTIARKRLPTDKRAKKESA